MHRELFKSILLGALVLASVAMTSNILFYKSDFENYDPNATKQIAIASAKELPEVIRPNLMLERTSTGAFGQYDEGQIKKVFAQLRQGVYSEQTDSRSQPAAVRTPRYELIFPAPLTYEALSKVFQFDHAKSLSSSQVLVDRVEVFSSADGQGVTAVFSSPDERDRFYMTVEHVDLDGLKALYAHAALRSFSRQALKGKIVYLPLDKTTVNAEVSYFERIDLEDFIPVLFTDPDNVFAARGKKEYTDSERQMERINNVIQFVNPGIANTSEQKQDVTLTSFDWMNSVKLWTDSYIYQGVALKNDQGDGTVTFRMTLGDYMVFNTETYPNWYLSMIELSWRNGELSNYRGTLLDLNPVDSQGSVTLDSGSEILDRLSHTRVQVKNIEDITIGYELKNPSSSTDQSIIATPDWFYRIGSRWYSVSDALAPVGSHAKEVQP